MRPQEELFDWRGFLFFAQFSVSLVVVGVALHYGTLYAAQALLPAPTALAQELAEPAPAPERTQPVSRPEPGALKWSKVGEAPWAPRDSAASFVFKDKMWTMGGLNGNGIEAGPEHAVKYWEAPYFNDIWSTEDGAHWQKERAAAEWAPRRSMTVVPFKGQLVMLGGWTPKVGYSGDVWVSDDATHWRKVLEQAPWPAREGHTLEVWGGRLWLMGGVNYDERRTMRDVWYSEDGVNWSQAPDAPWSARWDHASAVFGGALWVTGGMDLDRHTYGDVWSTQDGAHWERVLSRAPWMSRQGHQLVASGDTLYTLGRLNDDTTTGANDIWYTQEGAQWHKTAEDPPWIGREDHAALLYHDRLWVFGGMDANWHWQNDVWQSSLLSVQEPAAAPAAVTLSAKTAFAVYIDQSGSTVLLAQGQELEVPIASMTKLMTALVASYMFKSDDTVVFSGAALAGKGLSGVYTEGDTFFVKDALHALLIASHNESANALAQKAGTDYFVQKMNEQARTLGLKHTRFVNPSGLDPSLGEPNMSSAQDIATLLHYLYKQEPGLFRMLATPEYQLKDASGIPKTMLRTTDKLLGSNTALPVLGGKTGETPKAKQNLAVVAQASSGVVVGVVTGSHDSAADMRAMLQFAKDTVDSLLLQ